MALYFADEAIITTNPEVSSVRDSDRIRVSSPLNPAVRKMAKSRSKNTCC
jgi:septum formation inhibitor-activating ATPase MinD